MATLRQFEYLVAAADLGSITRAAAQEHVSQPALSHQIAALERSVGGPLLERLPRSVRLTPAGKAFLPHARSAITAAARASSAARQATGTEAGEIHVAAVYSVSLGILPAPLLVWRRERPGVTVRLHEYRHADEMMEAMRDGAADVAVGPTPERWEGTVRSLGDEELVVVIPSDDPLAGLNRPVDLRQLSDRGWVHYAAGHGLGDVLDAACKLAGFRPLVALRTEQTATAPLLAAAGMGPTLAPASALPADFGGVALPTAPPTRRAMAVYHRRNPDPLTAAFAKDLTRTAQLVPYRMAQPGHALG